MKKSSKHTAIGMSVGMCLGCGLGLCFGMTLFDNIAMGLPIGMMAGMGIGMAVGSAKDAAVNKQLEEKGYTVKSVTKQDGSDKYTVVISDKNGAEQSVTVDKDTMTAEQFKAGDAVYLDENNMLEKAYGDEADEDEQSDKKKK